MLSTFARASLTAAFNAGLLIVGFSPPLIAHAQTGPYETTTVGTINNTTPCGGSAEFTTTIDVTDHAIISDLDVGFLARHTWRSDIHFTLISPAGTSSALLTGPFATNANNYNVRLDDEAAGLVDQPPNNTNAAITAVPPYLSTVRPESVLNVFDGEDAFGIWTVRVCDIFSSSDNGRFLKSSLFITPVPAVLTAQKTVSVWDPTGLGLYALPGNDVVYAINAVNTGTGFTDTDSLFISDTVPADMVFYNGDIDDGGAETQAIAFADLGAGFNYSFGTDIGYSNAAAKPADMTACTYTPTAGYDPNVKHICIQPSGQMGFGTPNPEFTVKFRFRIK